MNVSEAPAAPVPHSRQPDRDGPMGRTVASCSCGWEAESNRPQHLGRTFRSHKEAAKDPQLSAAQQAVLAVVSVKGPSYVGRRTNLSTNTVGASAARALVRAGLLEEFLGADGAYVQAVTQAAR